MFFVCGKDFLLGMSRIVKKNKTPAMLIIVPGFFSLKDLAVWVDAEGLSCDGIRQGGVRWNKR